MAFDKLFPRDFLSIQVGKRGELGSARVLVICLHVSLAMEEPSMNQSLLTI